MLVYIFWQTVQKFNARRKKSNGLAVNITSSTFARRQTCGDPHRAVNLCFNSTRFMGFVLLLRSFVTRHL